MSCYKEEKEMERQRKGNKEDIITKEKGNRYRRQKKDKERGGGKGSIGKKPDKQRSPSTAKSPQHRHHNPNQSMTRPHPQNGTHMAHSPPRPYLISLDRISYSFEQLDYRQV